MSATLVGFWNDESFLTAVQKFNSDLSKHRLAQSPEMRKAKGAERMRKLHDLYEKIRQWKSLKNDNSATAPKTTNQKPGPSQDAA